MGKAPEFALLAGHIIENGMLNGEVIRIDGASRLGKLWIVWGGGIGSRPNPLDTDL